VTARPWIVTVGGSLGAGKTTLILAAARVLQERGVKTAAILNDQGRELVDTAYVRSQGVLAGQVTGACFCCRFSELITTLESLHALSPEVIFVEPVGSCTDLAATVLQPLKQDFLDRYRLAPLTVLVDPAAVTGNPGFLFENQIAEADIVVFTKCDLHAELPSLNHLEVRHLSARTGQGVNEWLTEVLSGTIAAGTRLLDLNYEEYARAEAALGWLNWGGCLGLERPISPAELIGPFLEDLQKALDAAGAEIAHLKVFDQTVGSYLKAAVTNNKDQPSVEGDLAASPEGEHNLRVNLRAVFPAEQLAGLFQRELAKVPGTRKDELFECFSPAAPKPERVRGISADAHAAFERDAR
jgi:Ni2+-binding GTPase involved in maturation of urease and hydrogenase